MRATLRRRRESEQTKGQISTPIYVCAVSSQQSAASSRQSRAPGARWLVEAILESYTRIRTLGAPDVVG